MSSDAPVSIIQVLFLVVAENTDALQIIPGWETFTIGSG